MEPGTPNGIAARVGTLERQQSEAFDRLRVVDRLDERTVQIQDDVAELKRGVNACNDNCTAIRSWVDARLKEEGERRRLSRGEIATFASVGIAAISAVVGALVATGLLGS